MSAAAPVVRRTLSAKLLEHGHGDSRPFLDEVHHD